MGKKPWTMAVMAAAFVLIVGACTPAASTAPSTAAQRAGAIGGCVAGRGRPSAAPAAMNLPAVPTGYTELDQALGSDQPMKGKKVSIQTQWTGGEATGFANAIADFRRRPASRSRSTASARATRPCSRPASRAGSRLTCHRSPSRPPCWPTPQQNKLIDVGTFMDQAKLNAEFPSTIGLTTEGDHIWSIPTKADVKSMIWYPVKAFAAKGYAVPEDLGRARRPSPTRSRPTAASRSASAPVAPARRRAGS